MSVAAPGLRGRGPKVWARPLVHPDLPMVKRIIVCARSQEQAGDLLAERIGAAAAPDRVRAGWSAATARDVRFVRGRPGVWFSTARPLRPKDYREAPVLSASSAYPLGYTAWR